MYVISRFYYIWLYLPNSQIIQLSFPPLPQSCVLPLLPPLLQRSASPVAPDQSPSPFPWIRSPAWSCAMTVVVVNTTAQHSRRFSSLPVTPPLFCLILLGAHHRSQPTTGHTAVTMSTRQVEPLLVSTPRRPPPSHLLSSCLIGVFVWEGENLNPMAVDFDLFRLIKLMFYANSKSEIACWEWIFEVGIVLMKSEEWNLMDECGNHGEFSANFDELVKFC